MAKADPASRVFEYKLWIRLTERGLGGSHGEAAPPADLAFRSSGSEAARGNGNCAPCARSAIQLCQAAALTARDVRRYLTFMRTRVSSKGQIVLPAEIRRQDGVLPGQEFEVERLERGDYRLVRRASRPNQGVVEWLLACPEKGFFVPVESESTDSL